MYVWTIMLCCAMCCVVYYCWSSKCDDAHKIIFHFIPLLSDIGKCVMLLKYIDCPFNLVIEVGNL